MKVKELIKQLRKQDPEADIAIGSTESRWSTLGCSIHFGDWFSDQVINHREYGNVYEVGSTPQRGKPVVLLIP